MKKAERFRKEIVLLFPVFLVFPDKAQGKSGNFLFPIFAYYTTTREKGELRPGCLPPEQKAHYTTTREKGELRLHQQDGWHIVDYTTTREKGELRPGCLPPEQKAHYTTTREKGELRPSPYTDAMRFYYTTTREKGELRLSDLPDVDAEHYTTTREKGELRHFGAGRPGGRPPVPCRRRREHGPGGTCPA